MPLRLSQLGAWHEAIKALNWSATFDRNKKVHVKRLIDAGWSDKLAQEEAILCTLAEMEADLQMTLKTGYPEIGKIRYMLVNGPLDSGVSRSEKTRYFEWAGIPPIEYEREEDELQDGEQTVEAVMGEPPVPTVNCSGLTAADIAWIVANRGNMGAKPKDAPSLIAWNVKQQAEEDDNLYRDLVKAAIPKEEKKDDSAEDVRAYEASDMKNKVRDGFKEFLGFALERMQDGATVEDVCKELVPDFF